jgi:hypothetical protein
LDHIGKFNQQGGDKVNFLTKRQKQSMSNFINLERNQNHNSESAGVNSQNLNAIDYKNTTNQSQLDFKEDKVYTNVIEETPGTRLEEKVEEGKKYQLMKLNSSELLIEVRSEISSSMLIDGNDDALYVMNDKVLNLEDRIAKGIHRVMILRKLKGKNPKDDRTSDEASDEEWQIAMKIQIMLQINSKRKKNMNPDWIALIGLIKILI